MAHTLKRLSKDLLTKPQLITPEKFEEIAEYIEHRNDGDFKLESFGDDNDDKGNVRQSTKKVGVIKIHGPISYRPTFAEAACGEGVSYESILRQADELCAMPDINDVLLDIDSGGGQAYRCFSTGRQLRKKCEAAGKRLIGYVDGLAASAAYAMASSCHELIINPDAEAGSIGVVIRLVNNSEQLKQAGLKVKYITAGAEKVPVDESGEFKESFLESLDTRVNQLYTQFINYVADMRGIDTKVVENTKAQIYNAEDSLRLGLVDKIMEGDEFENYLFGSDAADDAEDGNEDEDPNDPGMVSDPTEVEMNTKENKPEASADVEQRIADLEARLASAEASHAADAAKLAEYEAKEHDAVLAGIEDNLAKYGLEDTADVAVALDAGNVPADMFLNAMDKMLANKVEAVNAIKLEADEAAKAADDAAKEKDQAIEELKAQAAATTQEAEARVNKIKSEFGTEERGINAEVEQPTDFQAELKKAVQAQLIARNLNKNK